MPLDRYRDKRDFAKTPEPAGKPDAAGGRLYVIQKHAASRLHYDLRLELDGVLLSWAVPKGPSLDPAEKHLAVRVEDHPVEYGGFEGVIPKGEYGGGSVMVWDRGTWEPAGDPHEALERGDLKFVLHGDKLHGLWVLVKMRPRSSAERGENWLLMKERDAHARPGEGATALAGLDASVATGRTMDEIRAEADEVWHSEGPDKGLESPAGTRRAAATIPGARKATMPRSLVPEMCLLVKAPPAGEGWSHEIKFDGYRALCRVDGGKTRLISRNDKDWTDRFATIAQAAAVLPARQALLDGEVVVLGADGVSSFQALQDEIASKGGERLLYQAFDLLYLDGYDLTGATLEDRKAALEALLDAAGTPVGDRIRYTADVRGDGAAFFASACAHGLEGVVSKRGGSGYEPGRRGPDWLKVKCLLRQEFVVGGWTAPQRSRTGFGALLLGAYRDGELEFVGRVGTGFNDRRLAEISRRLSDLARESSPFSTDLPPIERRGGIHFVEPTLVAEVAFSEWTKDGHLRQPSFKGLREDKDAKDVVAEHVTDPTPSRPVAQRADKDVATVFGVRMTHPDKVMYPDDGITKRDLAEHYERLADLMLPYAFDRPVAAVRCPDGIGRGGRGGCFFYKHPAEDIAPPALKRLSITEGVGTNPYVAITSAEGLVSVVQMDVLEIHTWGSRASRLESPDRVVFDLDPDVDADFSRVLEGARLVRTLLDAIGLVAFVKTTGGKGLHVVVPLTGPHTWDGVRTFSHAVAEAIARTAPDRYTSMMPKARRQGRVFVDYLRNARGATAVEAYSTRAKPRATVSVPVRWDELGPKLRPDAYDIRNLPRRLAALRRDPWEGYFDVQQSITSKMRRELGLS